MTDDVTVEVDGHEVRLSSLDKVIYPATGTTKAAVVGYYAQVAHVLLPELAGRPVTRRRWPEGVGKEGFFEKNLPKGAPSWVRTVLIETPSSTRGRDRVTYPFVDSVAVLTWLANLAALELHVPQWRVADGAPLPPDRLVVDLDPGPGAGLDECCEVALAARDLLTGMGLGEIRAVTSGSKGMQLYAALPGRHDAAVVRDLAQGLARALEQTHPGLVVSSMTKTKRVGKVLVDWSQNSGTKTTICPWSLRGTTGRPTVAVPRAWDEVEAGGLRQLTIEEALGRL